MIQNFKCAIAVITAGIWVNVSEFFRNEYLLKTFWVSYYESHGMTFPSEPINGVIWLVWGFLFASAVYIVSRRFNLLQTALIGWLMGFVLMWLVAINLNAMPIYILAYAVPLSLLETSICTVICIKISPR